MSLHIRKGTRSDTEAFIQLLDTVRAGMGHKEWFYLDPPDDVRQMMETGEMQLWVAMDGEKMAAAFDIIIPGLHQHNYGYDLGFTEEQLLRVVNMDTAAVHPDYRGMGLQKKLMLLAQSEMQQIGNRILLCTVHPDNVFSLNNILGQGYAIEKKLEKYGSIRYLMRKDL